MPTIAIVSVAYGNFNRVRLLLESLRLSRVKPTEVVVVDNLASLDAHSVDLGSQLGSRVDVVHGRWGANVSAARNAGWRATASDVVFFIDDDNRIDPDTIGMLLRVVQQPGVGAVAPIAYLGNQDEIWCAGVVLKRWTGRTRFLRDPSALPP